MDGLGEVDGLGEAGILCLCVWVFVFSFRAQNGFDMWVSDWRGRILASISVCVCAEYLFAAERYSA